MIFATQLALCRYYSSFHYIKRRVSNHINYIGETEVPFSVSGHLRCFLWGEQRGYTKLPCFVCLWNSRVQVTLRVKHTGQKEKI